MYTCLVRVIVSFRNVKFAAAKLLSSLREHEKKKYLKVKRGKNQSHLILIVLFYLFCHMSNNLWIHIVTRTRPILLESRIVITYVYIYIYFQSDFFFIRCIYEIVFAFLWHLATCIHKFIDIPFFCVRPLLLLMVQLILHILYIIWVQT